VQIVENWAELEGELETVSQASDDMLDLRVRIVGITPVEGFPNLMADEAGNTIPVSLRIDEETPGLRVGQRIRLQVRKAAAERFFARPGTVSQE
jgi:hypothetical protein